MSAQAELQISPEILEFHPPYTRVITNTIKLTNLSQDRYVCFKIKTTSPKRYTVRPSSSIIPPLETYSVQVTLNFRKEPVQETGKDRDRFQIQSIFVPSEIPPSEIKSFDPKNLWNEVPPEQIMKYRLKTRKFVVSGTSLPNSSVNPLNTSETPERVHEEGASTTHQEDSVSPSSSPRDTNDLIQEQTSSIPPISSSGSAIETLDPSAGSLDSSTSSPSSSPYSSVLGDSSLTSSTPLEQTNIINFQKESLNNKIDELTAQYKRSGVEVGGGLSFRQRPSTEIKESSRTESSPLSSSSSSANSQTKQKQQSQQQVQGQQVRQVVVGWSSKSVIIIAVIFFLLGYLLKSSA